MNAPVIAKHNLDAFIPDTEIVVKIPGGTEGQIVRELRNDIVLVQFNVPSLGPLRVALHDLSVQDTFDLLLSQMEAMQHTSITDKAEAHSEADKVLIRTLRVLADESNQRTG